METIKSQVFWGIGLVFASVLVATGSSALGASVLDADTAPSAVVKAVVGSSILALVLIPITVCCRTQLGSSLGLLVCVLAGQTLGAVVLTGNSSPVDFTGAFLGFALMLFIFIFVTFVSISCVFTTNPRARSLWRLVSSFDEQPVVVEPALLPTSTWKLASQPGGEVLVALVV